MNRRERFLYISGQMSGYGFFAITIAALLSPKAFGIYDTLPLRDPSPVLVLSLAGIGILTAVLSYWLANKQASLKIGDDYGCDTNGCGADDCGK